MRNILLILAFLIGGFDAYGATAARGRAAPTTTQSGAKATTASSAGGRTTASRAPTARAATTQPKAVVGRSATNPASNTKTSSTSVGRSATPVKQARAAKQGVISNGTKIATANQNTAVDEECWDKFSGCMDSFCMLENTSGGRCICSDKNSEYDSILAEIQDLDNQSYQMATVGVERIEMGEDADAIMAKTKQITSSIEKDADKSKEKSKRKSLDLSSWNIGDTGFEDDVEDMFSLASDGAASLANKTGDALYRASAQLCSTQIPECKNDAKMMQLMYQQRIRSDCSAYENSLRQQRTQSAQKLAAAQSAMREAALEQYRNANKYDLGQCTIEFKKCMQTTAGCGDDFTGCVTQQTTRETLKGSSSVKMKQIKGASTTIEIAAWTYDALDAKKPLCMSVTQQCVNVRNQVWDTFLREVAPQIKSAELAAESNLRTSCISTISDCFQRACKDNIDPSNPDGSYDMCLTRPDTLRNLCKVQIDPCEATEPKIMDYVRARLASMRVDSCTKSFKECLQSEDRCGEDYSQCIGLDTDSIVHMCPAEKLVACQYDDNDQGGNARTGRKAQVKTDEKIYEELSKIATGIFLNIDNNMLATCQKAVNDAMVKVCGSTEDCNGLVIDSGLGARSLEYKICDITTTGTDQNAKPNIDYQKCRQSVDMITDEELGRNSVVISDYGAGVTERNSKQLASIIDGTIYWEKVEIPTTGNIDVDEYFEQITNSSAPSTKTTVARDGKPRTTEVASSNTQYQGINAEQQKRVSAELLALQSSIKNAIQAVESDPKVQYCMTGREVQGLGNQKIGTRSKTDPRFPEITYQARQLITTYALKQFRENYYEKYDELNDKMLKDYGKVAERLAEIRKLNNKDHLRNAARQSCVNMADMSAMARSAEPPASAGTYFVAAAAIAGGIASGAFLAGPILAGIILSSTNDDANGEDIDPKKEVLTGSKQMQQWNYKETVTTTFDWEKLICHKCVRSQRCDETKNPLVGDKYCKTWGEETETCSDTQF